MSEVKKKETASFIKRLEAYPEVAARFALGRMPGRLLAINSEIFAGTINQQQV